MEYLDERIIGLPNCSKDNLRKQIADLEIETLVSDPIKFL